MLFNKSFLILGLLAGASAAGGYFGASALDSHFSQKTPLLNSETDEAHEVTKQSTAKAPSTTLTTTSGERAPEGVEQQSASEPLDKR